MQIDVQNLQKRIPLKPKQIVLKAKRILRHEGIRQVSLSIAFVTDARIKTLNKKYLNANYATDVLAFDFSSSAGRKSNTQKKIFGEIIISTGAACRQAKIFQNSRERELALYLIHGILHLLGFDDHQPKDIKRMRAREQVLLDFLKI